jgi:DNA processing protein
MEAARTIRPDDGLYPEPLARRADRPDLLRLRGALPPARARVAVVGARHPDDYGRDVARRIAMGLARAGVSVVSGGALGVDGAAHEGALDAGGHTVAVLGAGLDRAGPADNRPLFERIVAAGGALLSELDDAAPATRWTFPRRNRIVSGMSDAVVVVRGGARSGALITASCARAQGVPLFAVPGDVDHPLSAGPVALLRSGARAAASAEDLLAALGIDAQACLPLAAPERADVPEGERVLLAALGPRPRHADELARAAGVAPGTALAGLLALELEGLCEQRPGHYFLRRAEG